MSWHSWFNVSGGAAALRSPVSAIARNPLGNFGNL